jgi:hypothetical protein
MQIVAPQKNGSLKNRLDFFGSYSRERERERERERIGATPKQGFSPVELGLIHPTL